MSKPIVHASLLIEGDQIFINRRKYSVLSRQPMDENNVKLLLKRNGLHHIMIHDRYDTFITIPSPNLTEV